MSEVQEPYRWDPASLAEARKAPDFDKLHAVEAWPFGKGGHQVRLKKSKTLLLRPGWRKP